MLMNNVVRSGGAKSTEAWVRNPKTKEKAVVKPGANRSNLLCAGVINIESAARKIATLKRNLPAMQAVGVVLASGYSPMHLKARELVSRLLQWCHPSICT